MTEIYPTMKPERSPSPTLQSQLDRPNGHDLSEVPRIKTESLSATKLSPLAIPMSTFIDIKTEHDVKHEDPFLSQSPTVVADATPQNFKASRSPTTPPSVADGTTSKSSTPPLAGQSRSGKKGSSVPVQLIGDLPVAREEALRSFSEIPDNNYQYKSLGLSREILESMTCDCTYEHGSSLVSLSFSFVVTIIPYMGWSTPWFATQPSRTLSYVSYRCRQPGQRLRSLFRLHQQVNTGRMPRR